MPTAARTARLSPPAVKLRRAPHDAQPVRRAAARSEAGADLGPSTQDRATVTAAFVLRMQLPADLQHRDLALRAVSSACRLLKKPATPDERADFLNQVVSAFGEAFNNVVLHAYKRQGEGTIEVEIESNAHCIAITIIDHGESFDLNQVPTPDLDTLPEHGLGVFIIKSFMDEVVYEAGPPNVLRLRKCTG